MERLTWTGIALHSGELPGYPDSHGCVRLPLEFSKWLYTVTQKGITFIIADEASAPRETVHPGVLFSQATPAAADPALALGEFSWTPEKAADGPVTILFGGADQQLYVYRNGVEIGRVEVAPVKVEGQHVYSALDGADEQGRRKWVRVDGKAEAHDPSFTEVAESARIPAEFVASIRTVVQPGTTMAITDQAVNAATQSGPNFKVLGVGEVATR